MDRRSFLRCCSMALPALPFLGGPTGCKRQPDAAGPPKTDNWDGIFERIDTDLASLAPGRPLGKHPAEYFEKLPGHKVKCTLCPHDCEIADGARGDCLVRANEGGELLALSYGGLCSLQLGSPAPFPLLGLMEEPYVLAGTYGCSFNCDFCSSLEQAMDFRNPEDLALIERSPGDLVQYARDKGAGHLSFGVFEPTVNFEYVRDTARLARSQGLKVHMFTSGFVHADPLRELLEYVDHLQVGIKGFDEAFYEQHCGGRLPPVLESLRLIREKDKLLSVGLLYIPGLTDDWDMVRGSFAWLKDNVGIDTPLWLCGFIPSRLLTRLPPTSTEYMQRVQAEAERTGFRYLSMVDSARGTITPDRIACYQCGETIIHRVSAREVVRHVQGGRCEYCGASIRLRS